MEDWFSEPRAGKLRLQWLVSRLRLVGRTVGASEPRAKLVSEPRCRASMPQAKLASDRNCVASEPCLPRFGSSGRLLITFGRSKVMNKH